MTTAKAFAESLRLAKGRRNIRGQVLATCQKTASDIHTDVMDNGHAVIVYSWPDRSRLAVGFRLAAALNSFDVLDDLPTEGEEGGDDAEE